MFPEPSSCNGGGAHLRIKKLEQRLKRSLCRSQAQAVVPPTVGAAEPEQEAGGQEQAGITRTN